MKSNQKDEDLKVLTLAMLTFCIRNNNPFIKIIQEASNFSIPEEVIRDAISKMGDDMYTILTLLATTGKMTRRLTKLLANNVPVDIQTPKTSKELIDRLKSDSFLFR